MMSRKGDLLKKISLKLKYKRSFIPKLYSPCVKLQNCVWIFTIGDPDDKPSVPHGHAKDVGYRLDVWTGNIYPAGKERKNTIGRLKTKELRKLYADKKFIDFAKKQISWYRLTYPHIKFYVPEWFELKTKQLQLTTKTKEKKIDTFIFIGKSIINQYRIHGETY